MRKHTHTQTHNRPASAYAWSTPCPCSAFWFQYSAILPDAVEDVPILKDPQQLVVGGDLVEIGALLVGEEEVGFPDGVQHGRVQIERVVGVLLVRQARVVPLLPEEHVQAVVLRRDGGSTANKETMKTFQLMMSESRCKC